MNIAVVSRHATAVFVCLFDEAGEVELYRFQLPNRMGDTFYGFIDHVPESTRYGLRADGPFDQTHRFDVQKLLVDPYATELDRPFNHMPELLQRGFDTAPLVPKAILRKSPGPAPPLPPHRPSFIYELPVKAFTKLHPDIPESQRGTVAALAHPSVIAHLKALHVDTVELMPLMAWIDERHLSALELTNAWGYNPVTFMAPDPRLAPGGFAEIRAAVAALHAAGLRVVLDVVLNHTGESDLAGTTLSLRGLDNALYFTGNNDSGCGNTIAAGRAPVVQLLMDALRCWVNETGLDGFRFDLASALGRTPDAPLFAAIAQDPLLKNLILIAEPWDMGGYHLGGFPPSWHEWNDRYRDDVRRFWRGDAGSANALATRIAGSSDIFAPHRPPSASINFIAAHDGFTLADLVSFTAKQNGSNGEGNRDGNGAEITWPGGDARALLATLFLSRGTAMLTAGDEFGRSQRGNNNAYAQDNTLTWLDWKRADRKLMGLVAELARLRAVAVRDTHLHPADAQWCGADGGPMNWTDGRARVLSLVLTEGRTAICVNGGVTTAAMAVKPRDGWRWRRLFSSGSDEGLPARSVSVFVEEAVKTSGVADETIRTLAEHAGIARDWWEVDGTYHDVPLDTLRHILNGLGLAHGSITDAAQSAAGLAARQPIILADQGRSFTAFAPAPQRRRFQARCDDGTTSTIDAKAGERPSFTLPMGRYTLTAEDGETRHALVRPDGCFVPEDIAQGKRTFGLASHLYALRHKSDGGIGDFETLKRFAALTHELGGRYTGINPLHHLFPADRSRVSPYQPSDRRYIDPIYISLAQLLADHPLPQTARLADGKRAAFAALEKLSHVDYTAHWQAKSALLESAFAEWRGTIAIDDDLARHGAFEAKAMGEDATPERIKYRAFLETVVRQQLARAGETKSLYRDLALGCAFDGGEIAEDPEAFVASVSLGAPPDPFSRNGQVWNLPGVSPLELVARGLAPMQSILKANMASAAALRIDHILGFARQFWVPRGDEGSKGAYTRFPMDELIALTAIESQRQHCLIVGEDLGTVPDGLRHALYHANIFSYRVLWFERDGLGFKRAAEYPAKALACLASHDLPTFMGWRRGRDIEIEQELGRRADNGERLRDIAALDQAIGNTSSEDRDAMIAAHGFIASTPSAIMLVQADDLAAEMEPLNVPGTDAERPNWRRRVKLTIEEIGASALARDVISRVKKERGRG